MLRGLDGLRQRIAPWWLVESGRQEVEELGKELEEAKVIAERTIAELCQLIVAL